MFQIDTSTASNSLPSPTSGGTPGFFSNGNVLSGSPATTLSADWCNGVQGELLSILARAGVTQSKSLLTQVLTSLARLGGWNSTVVTGTKTLNVDNAGLVTITASGAFTITLPLANALNGGSGTGTPIVFDVYRLDSNAAAVTIATTGSDSVNGASTLSVAAGARFQLISDGNNAWLSNTGSPNVHITGTLLVDGTTTMNSTLTVANGNIALNAIGGNVGQNALGNRTVQASSAGTPTGGANNDIVYQF